MNKFLQIACYVISFALVYCSGKILGSLVFQEVRQMQEIALMAPPVLEFFYNNHAIVSYFFLFPWLFFTGLPITSLCSRALLGYKFVSPAFQCLLVH